MLPASTGVPVNRRVVSSTSCVYSWSVSCKSFHNCASFSSLDDKIRIFCTEVAKAGEHSCRSPGTGDRFRIDLQGASVPIKLAFASRKEKLCLGRPRLGADEAPEYETQNTPGSERVPGPKLKNPCRDKRRAYFAELRRVNVLIARVEYRMIEQVDEARLHPYSLAFGDRDLLVYF